MNIGLTFDESMNLPVKPHKSASDGFPWAAEDSLVAVFAVTLTVAFNHLRSRGYDCRPEMLVIVVENGVVPLARGPVDDGGRGRRHFHSYYNDYRLMPLSIRRGEHVLCATLRPGTATMNGRSS